MSLSLRITILSLSLFIFHEDKNCQSQATLIQPQALVTIPAISCSLTVSMTMYSLVLLVTILTPSPEFSAFLLDYNTISYSCRVRVVDTWTISHLVAQINYEELLMGAEIAQHAKDRNHASLVRTDYLRRHTIVNASPDLAHDGVQFKKARNLKSTTASLVQTHLDRENPSQLFSSSSISRLSCVSAQERQKNDARQSPRMPPRML